jgi:raffinose/stachyose/melibiose transport system substrate-binding protein
MLLMAAPLASAQGDEQVITWWTEPNTVPSNIQELFIDPWNEAHPGYRLEISEHEDLDSVLRTAISAGEAPDILQTAGASFIAEFVKAGLVAPLDDYAAEWGWEEKLLPWAYQSGFIGGSLYSVPLTYESMILMYNKTLFEEKGWTPPTNLDEFTALAEAAVADGINPLVYGNVGWQPTNEHLVGIYLNNVAGPENVYKALIGEKPWTDPEFVEAMELLRTHIADNGWFSGSLENYFAIGWDDYWPEISTGTSAMMMIGSWGFWGGSAFEEAGTEWDWAPLPIFNERAGQYNYELATGSTLSVNATSKNADLAADVTRLPAQRCGSRAGAVLHAGLR